MHQITINLSFTSFDYIVQRFKVYFILSYLISFLMMIRFFSEHNKNKIVVLTLFKYSMYGGLCQRCKKEP